MNTAFFNKKLSTIFSPTKTTYWSIVLIYIILIWKAKAQMHCESTWTSQWGYWAAWRWQTEGRCPSWWIPPACGVWPHTWVGSPPRTPRGQRNRPAPRLLRQSEITEVVQPLTRKRKSKDQMPLVLSLLTQWNQKFKHSLSLLPEAFSPHWIIIWILIYEFQIIRDTYLRIKSSIFEDIVDNSSKKIQPTWIKTDKKTIPSARINSPKGSSSLVCQF